MKINIRKENFISEIMWFIAKLELMKPLAAYSILFLLITISCNNAQKPEQTSQPKQISQSEQASSSKQTVPPIEQEEWEPTRFNEKNAYTVKEVGWTVLLPDDWKVTSKRENRDQTKKSYTSKPGNTELINLLSFGKDRRNTFRSTMQPFTETADGDYDQKSITIHELIREMYRSKGIPFESYIGAVRIDGIMFDRLEIEVYTADKSRILFEQKIFNAYINGYDFAMIISYDNPDDKQILMSVVMTSEFSIKK